VDNLPDSAVYVADVERFAERKFEYFIQICWLVELATKNNKKFRLDDLMFLSKFITNAGNILERAGAVSEDITKLMTEYTGSIKKASSIVDDIILDANPEVKLLFNDFRNIDSGPSLQKFRTLIYELSWLKNYEIERKAER
jgi:hypothetical protein